MTAQLPVGASTGDYLEPLYLPVAGVLMILLACALLALSLWLSRK